MSFIIHVRDVCLMAYVNEGCFNYGYELVLIIDAEISKSLFLCSAMDFDNSNVDLIDINGRREFFFNKKNLLLFTDR